MKKITAISLFGIAVLVVTCSVSQSGSHSPTADNKLSNPTSALALPPANHDPIALVGDSAVQQFFGVSGVNGTGSAISPYILKNLSINLNGMNQSGINITQSDYHILIENTYIYNGNPSSGAGISLVNDSFVTIQAVILSNLFNGTDINNCSAINMTSCTIQDISNDGIFINNGSANLTLSDLSFIYINNNDAIDIAYSSEISLNGISANHVYGGEGIAVISCTIVSIANCTFDSIYYDGIYISNSNVTTLTEISINNVYEYYGIDVEHSNTITFHAINITNIDDEAIYIAYSNMTTLNEITLNSIDDTGIYIDHSNGSFLTDITTNVTSDEGIEIEYSNATTITNSVFKNADSEGLYFETSYGISMDNLTFIGYISDYCVEIDNCTNVNLTNSMENNAYEGIGIFDSSSDIYLGSISLLNVLDEGVDIESSSFDVSLSNIIIRGCLWDRGIYIGNADNVTMNNISVSNCFDDNGIDIENSNWVIMNNILVTNCVDSSGINIDSSSYISLNDAKITDVFYDLIGLSSSTNVNITNLMANDGQYGVNMGSCSEIYLGSCTFQGIDNDFYCNDWVNIQIQNCDFYGDNIGIYADANLDYQNLTVDGCYFANLNEGISLAGSIANPISNVVITHSIFENCNYALEASCVNYTNILWNIIGQCQADAMDLLGCNQFNITNNFIASTLGTKNYLITWYGNDSLNVVNNSFYGPSGCLFHYNSTSGTTNTMFNNSLGVGNYWSDYNLQNPGAVNNNGIWSIPYTINGSVVDTFPLVHDPNYQIPVIVGTPAIISDMNNNLTLAWNVYGFTSLINSYILYENGTPVQSGAWEDSSVVQVGISNAVFGNYNYTLWISDGITSEQSSTLVHINDYAPTLSQPANQTWLMGSGIHNITWAVNDSVVTNSTYDIRINGTVVLTGIWANPSDQITINLNASLNSWFNVVNFSSTTTNYTVIVTLDVSDGVLNSSQVVTIHINNLPATVTTSTMVPNTSGLTITIGVVIIVGIVGAVVILGIPFLRSFIKFKKAGSK